MHLWLDNTLIQTHPLIDCHLLRETREAAVLLLVGVAMFTVRQNQSVRYVLPNGVHSHNCINTIPA